jgi:hypothetical protein
MCIFSQSVHDVSGTDIFARGTNGQQFLVYSMSYTAAADLAMVLPLPVPPGPPEDAVRFIDLTGYPDFFGDLRRGFWRSGVAVGLPSSMAPPMAKPMLRVHAVGAFEASFVPTLADFDRLDPRFRLPARVWDQLPAYRDYGFAVFKLRVGGAPRVGGFLRRLLGGRQDPGVAAPAGEPEPRRVHPMAFEFPRRSPGLLYFPTVHVHDGEVHQVARFDHVLYCQADAEAKEYLGGWERSRQPAAAFVDVARAEGVVAPDRHCWRLPLAGLRRNQDTLVGAGGAVP